MNQWKEKENKENYGFITARVWGNTEGEHHNILKTNSKIKFSHLPMCSVCVAWKLWQQNPLAIGYSSSSPFPHFQFISPVSPVITTITLNFPLEHYQRTQNILGFEKGHCPSNWTITHFKTHRIITDQIHPDGRLSVTMLESSTGISTLSWFQNWHFPHNLII